MDATYYGELLGKEDIAQIGFLLSKFQEHELTYLQFEEEMKTIGYELDFESVDPNKIKTVVGAEALEDRIKNKTIKPKDVRAYYASNDSVGKIFFWYDRLMIDTLAEYGDKRAVEVREHLLKFESRFTPKKGK